MTGTAISLGVDGVPKPAVEPILSRSRMSPLRRNSLLHQGNLLHQSAHLHQGIHLPEESLLHQDPHFHQGEALKNTRRLFLPVSLTEKTKDSKESEILCQSCELFPDAHLHDEVLFNQEGHLHPGAHLHEENQSPVLHHEPKAKASLRVSERTWESRRIKEEMQGILSPTPLELHKVSSELLQKTLGKRFLLWCKADFNYDGGGGCNLKEKLWKYMYKSIIGFILCW